VYVLNNNAMYQEGSVCLINNNASNKGYALYCWSLRYCATIGMHPWNTEFEEVKIIIFMAITYHRVLKQILGFQSSD